MTTEASIQELAAIGLEHWPAGPVCFWAKRLEPWEHHILHLCWNEYRAEILALTTFDTLRDSDYRMELCQNWRDVINDPVALLAVASGIIPSAER